MELLEEVRYEIQGFGINPDEHSNKFGTNTRLCMVIEHLNSVNVSLNQTVSAGDLIGYSGNTGNVSGAHLHYTFCTKDDFDNSSNPVQNFVDPLMLHNNDVFYREVGGTYHQLLSID